MCGRYTLKNANADTIKASLREITRADWKQMLEWEREALRPNFNACPSQLLPTATMDADGGLNAHVMRWGLVPFWDKSEKPKLAPANARSEEAFAKPMFRQAVQKRRCAVPIDGFYEWKKLPDESKQPFHIGMKTGGSFWLAGIYEEATEIRPATYALLTTRPNVLMESIHDRMPVILSESSAETWLRPGTLSADTVASICQPFDAVRMEAWPVSRLVNSVRNNGPELVTPLDKIGDAPHAEKQGDLFG